MKFADGFWLNQRGYEVNYASQAYEITPVKNGLNIYATTQYIQNRGMTLGGPCLDVTITSTQKDVFKVTVEHFKGALDNAQESLSASSAGLFSTIIKIRDLQAVPGEVLPS